MDQYEKNPELCDIFRRNTFFRSLKILIAMGAFAVFQVSSKKRLE